MLSKKQISIQRSLYLQKIRDFFHQQKFIEVETPILNLIPGMEPHLTPFETTLQTPSGKNYPAFLNTSPELQMKKLLGEGFGNIFNLTKVFRNGEVGGGLHNPEFTMLEWYREKADYQNLMNDCEKLILNLLPKNKKNFSYQNQPIDFSPPWPKSSIQELFLKYCQIDLLKNRNFELFKKTANKKGFDTNHCQDWDEIFFKIFLNHIENKLPKNRPIFIFDYPATQAALAKKSTKNSFYAERFELYIGGLEIANAFSELIDSKEQKQRLKDEQKLRKKLQKTVFDIDEEFLNKLESIQHPCAGIALGIDRLLMILTDQSKIENVILFPISEKITS